MLWIFDFGHQSDDTGSAIANPILRPAIPQAFEKHLDTIGSGILTEDISEGLTEKSM